MEIGMTKPTLSLDEPKVAILIVCSASIAQSVGLVLNQLILLVQDYADSWMSRIALILISVAEKCVSNLLLTKNVVAYIYDYGKITFTNLITSLSQSDNHEASNSHAINATHINSAIPTNNSLKQWDNSNYRILSVNTAADIELIRAANLKNYSPTSAIFSLKNTGNYNRIQSKNIPFDIWTRINKIVRNDHQLDNKTNLVLSNNAKTNKHTNNREHY